MAESGKNEKTQVVNDAEMLQAILKAMKAVDASLVVVAGSKGIIEINVEWLDLPDFTVFPINQEERDN